MILATERQSYEEIEKTPGSTGKTGKSSAIRLACQDRLVQRFDIGVGIAIKDPAQAIVVELAHPSGDDDGGEDVAEEVGDGADLGHEALDPEKQGEAADRQNTERRHRR